MPKVIIQSKQAPVTGFTTGKPSPLAQAIRAGDFIYVSGQGPLDPVTRQVVSDDVREQARAVLGNIQTVLEAGGATIAHIVNVRVSLRDTADFAAFNEVFTEWVDGEKVTRTCVGALPHRAGVKVEVDCVAYLG